MLNKKYSAILSLTVVLASCAGPESYQEKMARYTPKNATPNQVPEIASPDFKFASSKTSSATRGPASAPVEPGMKNEPKEATTTNKKLYFLSLYSQFEELKNFSSDFDGPTVNICPNFHTSLLRHNESKTNKPYAQSIKKFTYDSTKLNNDMYVASFPELLLPISKDELTPKVIDVIRNKNENINEFAINELVHKAIDIHLAKTYSEISQLCEYGVSDNYYIYENLITHIKNNKFEADTKNMNILLKTTIFSNFALMTSLDKHAGTNKSGRFIASVDTTEKAKPIYSTEVMKRLNVSWANQYYDFIKTSH